MAYRLEKTKSPGRSKTPASVLSLSPDRARTPASSTGNHVLKHSLHVTAVVDRVYRRAGRLSEPLGPEFFGEARERVLPSAGSALTGDDLSLNSRREEVEPDPEQEVGNGLP